MEMEEIDLWISLTGWPKSSGQAGFCAANIRVDRWPGNV